MLLIRLELIGSDDKSKVCCIPFRPKEARDNVMTPPPRPNELEIETGHAQSNAT